MMRELPRPCRVAVEVYGCPVTQSLNTTSSMGRITLNVLLSFAQFEREVIGERVRGLSLDTLRARWREMTERNALKILSRELLANASRAPRPSAFTFEAISRLVAALSGMLAGIPTERGRSHHRRSTSSFAHTIRHLAPRVIAT